MTSPAPNQLYTTEDAAKILNVDPESVRRYVRSGELKAISLGNKFIRIDKSDLDNFIEERKVGINKLPPAKSGSIWHSPLNVYWHVQKITQEVGQEGLEKHPKFKMIRESQIAAVVALAMFKIRNIPAYIQLYKPDPPDALVMQPSKLNKGTLDISTLEITQYRGDGRESLLEQLKRKKIKPGINILSEYFVLVVDLWPGVTVDLKELHEYLIENKTPFPVWVIQETQKSPDTLAELTIVNPEIHKIPINLGESAFMYQKLGFPDVLNTRRVADPALVRTEKAEKFYDPPWETIGK